MTANAFYIFTIILTETYIYNPLRCIRLREIYLIEVGRAVAVLYTIDSERAYVFKDILPLLCLLHAILLFLFFQAHCEIRLHLPPQHESIELRKNKNSVWLVPGIC